MNDADKSVIFSDMQVIRKENYCAEPNFSSLKSHLEFKVEQKAKLVNINNIKLTT